MPPTPGRLLMFVRDITVRKLARTAGIDEGFVSACLAGKRKASPKLANAARQLGFEPSELFEQL